MKQKKSKKNKRKPWVAVVAGICAVALAVSSVVYLFDFISASPWEEETQLDQLHRMADQLEQNIQQEQDEERLVNLLYEQGVVYYQIAYWKMMTGEEGEQEDYLMKSIDALERGFQKAPDDPRFPLMKFDSYYNLGKDEKADQNAQEAEKLIKTALEQENLGEEEAQYRFNWATLLWNYHEDASAAQEQLKIVKSMEDEDSEMYSNAQRMLNNIKQDLEAQEEWDEEWDIEVREKDESEEEEDSKENHNN